LACLHLRSCAWPARQPVKAKWNLNGHAIAMRCSTDYGAFSPARIPATEVILAAVHNAPENLRH